MDDNDSKEAVPIPMIVERRQQRAELSSAEVMRILRKRAAKAAKREAEERDSAN